MNRRELMRVVATTSAGLIILARAEPAWFTQAHRDYLAAWREACNPGARWSANAASMSFAYLQGGSTMLTREGRTINIHGWLQAYIPGANHVLLVPMVLGETMSADRLDELVHHVLRKPWCREERLAIVGSGALA